MKVTRLIAVFFAVILFLSACEKTVTPSQQSNNTSSQNQTQMQVGYAEIAIPGRNFNPDSLIVAVGTTVNWVSRDGEIHTITSDNPNLFNGTLDPFGSFSFTFNQTGDYEYFCAVHGQMGMRGVVHVK